MTSKSIEKIAADANVLLSAAVGRAARRVFLAPGLEVVTTNSAYDEVLEYLPRLAKKYGLDLGLAEESLALLPVERCKEGVFRRQLPAARRYLSHRDPDDVPLAALALSLGIPIWSNDRDFDEVPIEVYTTAQLIRVLGV